jgi:hypothetical protein
MQIQKVPVPAGDRAEQLIANLTLSIIAPQLNAKATASEYLVEAHRLAADLANETLTYRPLQPSKFARLTFDIDGKTSALVFSIINDILVIPAISFDATGGRATNILGFDVTRFMLRIRTRTTSAVLEELKNTASSLRGWSIGRRNSCPNVFITNNRLRTRSTAPVSALR